MSFLKSFFQTDKKTENHKEEEKSPQPEEEPERITFGEITVLKGDVTVSGLSNTRTRWGKESDCWLFFETGCEIRHRRWDEGIMGCVYQIRERVFKDLSFMDGQTVEKLSEEAEIREYPDGTRFLYSCFGLPIFDSGDRKWGSRKSTVLYCDGDDVIMISSTFGYKIPRIDVYTGLKKMMPKIAELLKSIGYRGNAEIDEDIV